MRRLLTLTAALTVLLAAPFVAGAVSFESWGHWSGTGERHVTVYDHTSPAWDHGVREASRIWSMSPYIELHVVDAPEPPQGTCPWPSDGIAVCAEPNGGAGWQGWASQENSGEHFIRARAWLANNYGDASWSLYGMQWIACHEIGHNLGLSYHQRNKSGSCIGGNSATPNSLDYQRLAELYAHSP